LTITAVLAFTLLTELGVWQLHRLAWKQGLLARIESLRHAPPRPIGGLSARLAAGEDVEFTRVSVDCAPPPAPSPTVYRYALRDGAIGWRLLTACHLLPAADGGGFDGVVLDRGLVERFTGAMAPMAALFNEPVAATGVLRAVGARPLLDLGGSPPDQGVAVIRVVDRQALRRLVAMSGLRRPVPYIMAVESESPPLAGVRPAALPQDIPNNHFVYALTWFALAGILAWFYGALLWRRLTRP
jgi:surfeit locus 1 family protein